jgi:hypothetical protein
VSSFLECEENAAAIDQHSNAITHLPAAKDSLDR